MTTFWPAKYRNGIVLEVKVQPRASASVVVGLMGNCLKVKVTAPPVEGEANEQVIKLLSSFFRVPKSKVSVISGQTDRKKRIYIEGLSPLAAKKTIELYDYSP